MKIESLFLEITDKCNKQCEYCYQNINAVSHIHKPEMNRQLAEQIIAQAQEIGVNKIIISGGEPTLHPHFNDIVSYVIYHHMKCRINSNASMTEKIIRTVQINRKYEDKLEFQFTIDGYGDLHESFRGKGDYEQVKSTLKELRKCGYGGTIALRYNLNRTDVDEIEKVYRDFSSMATYIFLAPVFGEHANKISVEDYGCLYRYVEQKRDKKISLFVPPLACKIPHISENTVCSPLIDAAGGMYICQLALHRPDFFLGNLNTDSLKSLLAEGHIESVRRKLKERNCGLKCSLKNMCEGGCKGLCTLAEGDGFCNLRKIIFIKGYKRSEYQCWGEMG